MAVFRKQQGMKSTNHRASLKKDNNYVIDIFNTSSIDFFLREEPLTFEDPDLIVTISSISLKVINNKKKV